jgi:ubiquitin C-terminal hydrolase
MEGLANLGATCAINSLIQILYRINDFKKLILNSNTAEGTITNELKDLFEVLNKHNSISPNRFINNFYEIFKGIFNKYEQQDICELYLFLIQKIHDETCRPIPENKSISNLSEEHNYKIAFYNDFKYSNIYRLFQGSYIHIIKCLSCNHIAKTFEPFILISLDIEPNSTLNDLLTNHFITEIRNKDDWKCNNCNNNCDYSKSKRIWKYPEILFISLNRFKEVIRKNMDNVKINKSLELARTYELQAIGFHHGSLQGGHYNAMSRNYENYNLYDDTNVSNIPNIDLLLNNNNSYLLCYII